MVNHKCCHPLCWQGQIFSMVDLWGPFVLCQCLLTPPRLIPSSSDSSSWLMDTTDALMAFCFSATLFAVCYLYSLVTHFPSPCNSSHARPLLYLQLALHLNKITTLCKPWGSRAVAKAVTDRERTRRKQPDWNPPSPLKFKLPFSFLLVSLLSLPEEPVQLSFLGILRRQFC